MSDVDFRRIVDAVPAIVWVSALDGTTDYVNAQGVAYVGHGAEVSLGWGGMALAHPDDADRVRAACVEAMRSPAPFELDCRIERVDGTFHWHTLRGVPFRDERGLVVKWIGTATALERPEPALLGIIESKAPIGVLFVDRDLRIVRINPMLASIQGLTVAELLGQTLADAFPDRWPTVEPTYRRVLAGEAVLDVELGDLAPDDRQRSRVWMASYYPVVVDDEVVGVAVIVVDIFERKAMAAVRQQLAAIVEGSGDAILGTTLDGTITSWNGAAERLLGYTADEAIGRPVSIIASAAVVIEQAAMRARLVAGGPPEHVETTRRRKDGTLVDVVITASTTSGEAGAVVGLSVIAHDITDRRRRQRALEASQRRLMEAQRIAHLGSFDFDLVSGGLAWSPEYFRILGLDPAQTPSIDLFASMVQPIDVQAVGRAWADVTERGLPLDIEFGIIRSDSEARWVRARGIAEMAEDGTVLKVAGTMMDDTDKVVTERVRRAAETRFEVGFEQSAVGAIIADLDGVPIRVNAAACAQLGQSQDQLIGHRFSDFTHPDDVPLGLAMHTRVLAGHDTHSDERRYVRPDGTWGWTLCDVTLVRDEAGAPQYFFMQLQDITRHKRLELELAHHALHDVLTGLPNRALLIDRLVHGLAGAQRRSSTLGVMFLDIDQFKSVNDFVGHRAGDDLLKHVANRIVAAIRPGDTVARFDGDEFVIVCDDVSVVEAEQIGERVVRSLSQPFKIGSHQAHVTASLGIAIADDVATPESLLRDSDTAMYRAKERGRGRVELFDETLRAKAERRLGIAAALDRALERDEFTVHYQPVVDLATGAMVSAEALLRWNHPGRGLISPVELIPLAEDTGLIVTIGAWLLDEACRALVEWQDGQRSASGPERLSVAVNLSVRQLQTPDIAGVVDTVLTRTGVLPADLCLELTETVFMEDVEYFERTLGGLKELGVSLAIDDFGTGYSSLSYLKRFPIDAVKVDKAFVDGLGTDPHDTALVAAIVAMAAALDLEVTAEGVETRQQLIELKKLHVPRVQGFYLAKPMPAVAVGRLLAASHRWVVD